MGKLEIEKKQIAGIQVRGLGIKAQKQEFNTDSGLPQLGMGSGKDTKICEVQFFALNQSRDQRVKQTAK